MGLMEALRRVFAAQESRPPTIIAREESGTGKFQTPSSYRRELTDPEEFTEVDSRAALLEQQIDALAARRRASRQRTAVNHG